MTIRETAELQDIQCPEILGPLVLWVDGVGGFLLYLDDQVSLGGPEGRAAAHVAITGDIKPEHATIIRENDWYLLGGAGPIVVNGKKLEGWCVLTNGAEIQLGTSVRLRFVRPNSLSSSGRLEILSTHRTLPRSKGIVLFGNVCILGAGSATHIPVEHWPHEVVLYRKEKTIWIRTSGNFTINGVKFELRAPLPVPCRIAGPDFSFALEPLNR